MTMRRYIPICGAILAWLSLCFPALATQYRPVYQSQSLACTQSANVSPSAGTSTRLVLSAGTLSNGQQPQIYLCGWDVSTPSTQTVQFQYGATGTNCPSPTTITPALSAASNAPLVDHQPFYAGITPVPDGNDLCVLTGNANAASIIIYYTQF